jgi:hypothetical protein
VGKLFVGRGLPGTSPSNFPLDNCLVDGSGGLVWAWISLVPFTSTNIPKNQL